MWTSSIFSSWRFHFLFPFYSFNCFVCFFIFCYFKRCRGNSRNSGIFSSRFIFNPRLTGSHRSVCSKTDLKLMLFTNPWYIKFNTNTKRFLIPTGIPHLFRPLSLSPLFPPLSLFLLLSPSSTRGEKLLKTSIPKVQTAILNKRLSFLIFFED